MRSGDPPSIKEEELAKCGGGCCVPENSDAVGRKVIVARSVAVKVIGTSSFLTKERVKADAEAFIPGFPLGLRIEPFSGLPLHQGYSSPCHRMKDHARP